MKILVIPDTHGYNLQEMGFKNYPINDYDRIIFLGDFFDSKTHDFNRQVISFKEIIDLYNSLSPQDQEKFIFLYGNHDIHYHTEYHGIARTGSGYTRNRNFTVTYLLEQLPFQAAYQINNTLFTHAGLTNKLYQRLQNLLSDIFDFNELDKVINYAFRHKIQELFFVSKQRSGFDPYSGIFWADKNELIQDPAPHIDQVVGHTFQPSNSTPDVVFINDPTQIADQEQLHKRMEEIGQPTLYFGDIGQVFELEL